MGANSSGLSPNDKPGTPRPVSGYSRYMPMSYSEMFWSRDKKKKVCSFATLKKKLIRRRRTSKSQDHTKAFRELVADWNPRDLNMLMDEYEATYALKDLAFQADFARSLANTYKQGLSELFQYKYCTDVDLIFENVCFPVHRAILCARCPYFRHLLGRYPDYGAQVHVDIRTPGIDVTMFSALLHYLYTGDFNTDDSKLDNTEVLTQLGDEFGTLNPLEHDLRYLLESGEYSDAVLVFASDADLQQGTDESSNCTANSGPNCVELKCHKAILSARSTFFRHLIQRRARSGEELTERALQAPTRIVLDESVIPKCYARILLQAIYLDVVDLSSIIRGSSSTSSLSEVQAMVAGKAHLTHTEEAVELYQIGRFLDLNVLSQGCEDIIADSITIDNLISVLKWSMEPHGSEWVRHQALHFLREDFNSIINSPVLLELDKKVLVEVLKSDFLQASELDILTAIFKWGEHQLIKRMEEREPNLLNHTAHSVSKKGVRKRDLNDVELREILSEILPLVRMDHVIPPSNEVLNNAIKRGLVSTPPSHMIGDEGVNYRVNAWLRGKNNGLFVKPRLFTPYIEETKALLDEQMVQEMELVNLRMIRMSHIPDTLYMVDAKDPSSPSVQRQYSPYPLASCDIIAGEMPVPEVEVLRAMLRREYELRHTSCTQRAYALCCSDRRAINRLIQLRVVREFSLPDCCVEILKNVNYYYPDEVLMQGDNPSLGSSYHSRKYLGKIKSENLQLSSSGSSYSALENTSTCSDSILSDIMPDIAMATASFNQMSLQDSELDLGDGACHSGSMFL